MYMYGAILGDIIGSPYEFDRGNKTKDFPLFSDQSAFTDDTVMTIAVAEALMDSMGKGKAELQAALIASMQKWGRKYPDAGYGGRFGVWLTEKDPQPYGSYGNGSAMRVSAAGWLYDSLEETLEKAKWTAEVTHNHPEGIKGAQATAAVIWMARKGKSKEEIRDYVVSQFGYDLSRTCDEIRPGYHHVESCQETVPEAITCFLEGENFEDVVRTAVSLGGDCDTLACIAGSMSEACDSISQELKDECAARIPEEMMDVLEQFDDLKWNMCMLYADVSPDDYTEPEESAEEINRKLDEAKDVLEVWRLILKTGGIYRFEPIEGETDTEPFEGFPVGETCEDLLFKVTKGNSILQRGCTVGVDMHELCFELNVIKL